MHALRISLALIALASPGVHAAACLAPDTAEPRTLVLALDGVPFRVIEAARERGAFDGWPAPVPLVSSFPSLTNVAFTEMFERFDVAPAGGYEVRHFDWDRNRVVGGSLLGYGDRLFAWRDAFDVTGRTVRGKLFLYTRPRKHSRKQLQQAVEAMLASESDLVLAHIGATDALQHLRGDEKVTRFVLEVDAAIDELRERHRLERGRPLRVVLLSDHGNTEKKVRPVKGVRKSLRRAGLRPAAHLRNPGDVVAKTFGVVSYGALFVDADHAPAAARAVASVRGVDLAAWIAGTRELKVISSDGEATVRWLERDGRRRFSYRAEHGDPLQLETAVERLRAAGSLDADGFADAGRWLAASLAAQFPDAPRRLVDALATGPLQNPATVIFSTRPGYSWGLRSAHYSSRIAGGLLEGTHGGLDRASSLAFFMSDDPELTRQSVLNLESALASFTDLGRCVHHQHLQAADPDSD